MKTKDIEQIQLGEGAIVWFSTAWSSLSENHRNALKNQIAQNPFEFYSISHCPLVGGILFSQRPCGVDFEVTSRVEKKIIERVSSETEMQYILDKKISAAKLWTAKESSWKSLQGFHQPDTISSMMIQFQQVEESMDRCKELLNCTSYQASANIQQVHRVLIKGFCWEIPLAEKSDSVTTAVSFR